MKVRLVLYCPRCGSNSFRPSSLRQAKDAIFRSFGLKPQRCRMCRKRFYSFSLDDLRNWLNLLEGGRTETQQFEPTPVPPLDVPKRRAASGGMDRTP